MMGMASSFTHAHTTSGVSRLQKWSKGLIWRDGFWSMFFSQPSSSFFLSIPLDGWGVGCHLSLPFRVQCSFRRR